MKPLVRSPKFAVCLVLAALANLAKGNDLATDLWLRPHEVLGTQSCSSVSCHGQLQPQNSATNIHGQAYQLWLAHDPHARAGLRMLQPRFQEVLRRASNRADGGASPAVHKQCAKCHDPLDAARSNALALRLSHGERERISGQGIGCESCHGSARQWIARHYELGVSRAELRELGMVDTNDVLVRARLCASCHVGSAENDVTHDMLAAGHPPLRFEMASHQALIERKHWDDTGRRKTEPDYEMQLWAAGRVAATEAALALLEARANRAAADETRIDTDKDNRGVWPELAEYRCFACHQSLRPAVSGKASLAQVTRRAPGVPPWQQWNFECLPLRSPAFTAALERVRSEMEGSLSPPPTNIARLAADARSALLTAIRDSGAAQRDASTALQAVAARGPFTWERACHELAALTALQRSFQDRGTSITSAGAPFRDRTTNAARSLAFTSNRSEWPAVLDVPLGSSPGAGTMSLDQIATELECLAQRLHSSPSSISH